MDKLVIALNLVIDYIETRNLPNEKDISDYLFNTGFDDHEVRQVLYLLDISAQKALFSHRVFTKKERKAFTDDALAYLQKLYITGVLDIMSMEDVLEASMTTETFKIDIEQVKNIVLFNILERKSLMQFVEDSEEEYLH